MLMAVSAIQSEQYGLYAGQTSGTDEMGMDQFLNLLITQIRHQDPLSPMDNQQFISQLTQFTSLEQLQGVNSRLEENMMLTQSLNNTMLLGLVGRSVTVAGSLTSVSEGVASNTQVQAARAGTATIEVRDEAGILVSSYEVPVQAGWADITWDGLNSDGEAVGDGTYSLTIEIKDSEQNAVPFDAYMTGTVDGIRFVDNMAVVEVCGKDYYVSEIVEVRSE
jgi:flagellar basal-body rod modification protein FlgD